MGRLQDELDALAARLGRSLTLDGPDGELLAHSLQRDDADPARVAAILRRRVAPEVRAWEARYLDGDARRPVPVRGCPELGLSARLGLPIRDPRGGQTVGSLWMPDTSVPLTQDELRAVGTAAIRLGDLLARPVAPQRNLDLLVRRLTDDDSPGDALNQLCDAVPSLVGGTVRFVAAVPTGAPGSGAQPLAPDEYGALANSITPTLRAHPGYLGSTVALEHLLVLARDGTCSLDPLLDQLDALVGRRGRRAATIGISDPAAFTGRAVRRAIRQARTAAELAALDPALPRHSRWSGLGAYRSLLDTRPDDGALAGLDAAGASAPMLLHTLETYLDLGGDVQATAVRLTLHRSSLYYRLDRIGRLLEVDLSDGLARLDLHLRLKARRAARRRLR